MSLLKLVNFFFWTSKFFICFGPVVSSFQIRFAFNGVFRFDVIDLDPYGSPTPFLDSALQAVADGGN